MFPPTSNPFLSLLPPLLLLFLLLLPPPVAPRFVVEKNNLHVTAPQSLQGTYNSAMGNFGVPKYGGSMTGQLVSPEKGASGCKPFSDFNVSLRRSSPLAFPTVALLDRGDCYFALKVWNAQNAGAAAVLVADDRVETLITMDSPEEDTATAAYLQNITIPSALIEKNLGSDLKKALEKGDMVTVKLDWTESLPHPDERVEYEFWTNSNDECGPKCDAQTEFVKNFKGAAQLLERGSYTLFTPHYITWYCPEAFILSKQCKSQCINHGRYCAPDPEQDFSQGYDGKDVVMENLRQLCVYKVLNETNKPWVWWDYVTDFHARCPMKEKRYNKECAEKVIESLGISVKKVTDCMGNPDANADNPLLKAEQHAQVGQGSRGDVTILPTLIINNKQYRGKLDKGAVLKAVCAGFKESTEPPVCLNQDMETNECLTNNGGCWLNSESNLTACKDTFRGRICECPVVLGVQFQGDGYTYCEAVGPARCKINDGGCWADTRDGKTFSACMGSQLKGCECPVGFRGDGRSLCEDIDECKERRACQCPDCTCTNKYGDYDCTCKGDRLYIREQDACVGSTGTSRFSLAAFLLLLAGLAVLCTGGYVIYKYRLRSYMDSEIRAIMAQYMPLDNQGDLYQHL